MMDFTARRTMMVDNQVRPSDVTKFPIIEAMLHVPRELFVPAARRELAYLGENLEIGGGRVLLEPRTLAKLLDALDIRGDQLVLDIACGTGYSTAVIARLAEAVVGVEEIADMAAEAEALLAETNSDNAAIVHGPLPEGSARHGPFDAIVIQGAVEEVPQAILDQLKDGGRIGCLFMTGGLGVARVGIKHDGQIAWRDAFNAAAPVLAGFARAPAFTF